MIRVSAVMITRGRQALARQAVDCFLSQTYPHKELVILDDHADRSFPNGSGELPAHAPVLYFMHSSRVIAEKRNVANALAFGDVLMHWDSDDFSSPDRMAHQVHMLGDYGKSVVGYHSMLFAHENGSVYKYIGPPDYAIGTSLAYLKSWWVDHRFSEDRSNTEDNRMVRQAQLEKQIVSVDAGHRMVARIHLNSSTQHRLDDKGGSMHSFVPKLPSDLPEAFLR